MEYQLQYSGRVECWRWVAWSGKEEELGFFFFFFFFFFFPASPFGSSRVSGVSSIGVWRGIH